MPRWKAPRSPIRSLAMRCRRRTVRQPRQKAPAPVTRTTMRPQATHPSRTTRKPSSRLPPRQMTRKSSPQLAPKARRSARVTSSESYRPTCQPRPASGLKPCGRNTTSFTRRSSKYRPVSASGSKPYNPPARRQTSSAPPCNICAQSIQARQRVCSRRTT